MGLGAVLVGIINALAWPAAVMFIAIGYKPELATLLPALLRRGFGIERYAPVRRSMQQSSGPPPPSPRLSRES